MKKLYNFLVLKIIFSLPLVCTKKPNILFIIVDDLRPALGIYGDENAYTPHIDKFAKKSFIFTNAYAQQALCAPSRNSLLTSRRPDSLHLYDFYNFWRDSVGNYTTLPQHFRENGYHTHSIGKIFHPGISSNYTDDAYYSWSETPFHPKTEKYKETPVCVNSNGNNLSRNLLCPVIVEEQPEGTLPDLESLQAARDFLKKHQSLDESFFLAVGFHKPHLPLKFPVEYLNYHPIEKIKLPKHRWRPSSMPSVAWNPWLDVKSRDDIKRLNITFPYGRMSDYMMRKIIQHYNAATTYIDDLIGILLNEVNQDTIIILTADHGWSLGEHGEFSKFSNFNVATRVPLLIHIPNFTKFPIILNDLVELVDLFPTLVDLTQVSESLEICPKSKLNIKLCTEGQSLVPLLINNKKNKKKAVFTQYPRPGPYPTENPNSDKPHLKDIKIMGYSMRTLDYRFTEWIKFNHSTFTPQWSKTFGTELYNHLIDPDENLNLADRNELKLMINKLRKQLKLGWRFAI